jgi:hypothetical protein
MRQSWHVGDLYGMQVLPQVIRQAHRANSTFRDAKGYLAVSIERVAATRKPVCLIPRSAGNEETMCKPLWESSSCLRSW